MCQMRLSRVLAQLTLTRDQPHITLPAIILNALPKDGIVEQLEEILPKWTLGLPSEIVVVYNVRSHPLGLCKANPSVDSCQA